MKTIAWLALAVGLALAPIRAAHAQEPMPYVAEAMQHAGQVNGVTYRWMKCLAWKESNWLPWVGSFYKGLYQFDQQTWDYWAPRFGFAGYPREHAWANAHVHAGMVRTRSLAQTHGTWPPSVGCGSPQE